MKKEIEQKDELLIMFDYLKKNGVLEMKRGERIEIKCIYCGGKVEASKVPSNGHLWVTCDNCGVLLYQ